MAQKNVTFVIISHTLMNTSMNDNGICISRKTDIPIHLYNKWLTKHGDTDVTYGKLSVQIVIRDQ